MERVSRTLSRRRLLKGAVAATAVPIAAACIGDPGTSGASTNASPAATARGVATNGPSAAAAKLSGNLNILQGSHFLPEFDGYVDRWAADWGAKNGVRVKIDRIPAADLPARFAAEAAVRTGHDLVGHFSNGLPALFARSLVNISDIADRAANRYGGWIPAAEAIGIVKGKWYGLPDFMVPYLSSWRTDIWKASGFTRDHLETWDDLFTMAPKLNAAGHPVGCAMSHASDAEHTWRSLMWSYGAYEFTRDGASVAIDSNETRQVLELAKRLFGQMEPAVVTWTDADNTGYLQSGKGAWIYDPIGTYRAIETRDRPLADRIVIDNPLRGPKEQVCSIQFTVYGIWSFSKNIDAARQFLVDYSDDWAGQLTASKGHNFPFLKGHQTRPMAVLGGDPKLAHLQDVARFVQPIGYPGPSSPAAYDSLNAHVVTDMFTSYATGKKSLDDAVVEAKRRLEDTLKRLPP